MRGATMPMRASKRSAASPLAANCVGRGCSSISSMFNSGLALVASMSISGGQVADGFDVVAVWIAHEGAVVMRVVLRAQARCAAVGGAGGERRGVKRVHDCARRRGERDVQAAARGLTSADPEEGLALAAEAGMPRVGAGHLRRHFHDETDAERRECLQIELLAALEIRDLEAD